MELKQKMSFGEAMLGALPVLIAGFVIIPTVARANHESLEKFSAR